MHLRASLNSSNSSTGLETGHTQLNGLAALLPSSLLHTNRLDTSPLQDLARQNYSAEVIKYAGGSPLSGTTVLQPLGVQWHPDNAARGLGLPQL